MYETAYKDYELRVLHLPENIAAFPVILDYHQQMMSPIDKGRLTPATVADVFDRQAEMNTAVLRSVGSRQGPADQGEGETWRRRATLGSQRHSPASLRSRLFRPDCRAGTRASARGRGG